MRDGPVGADADGVEAGYTLALRPGTRLGDRYVVLRLLAGASDFALTYLAHDSRNDTAVVVKELLPRGLVGRGAGMAVRPHSPDAEREFARVLRRFVREGEVLVDLRHEALPTALDVVEEYGTAYLVMPQHDALRLTDYLPTVGGRVPTAEAVVFANGLLGALETLHAEGILHREVSPQTVHVRQDGGPLLLGLGAWRHVPGRSREPVPGFDPIEQYGGRDVGPWSDVYGAAAVLYYLVTGNVPVSAIDRAGGTQLRSPGVWARDVSPPMAAAIMRGLALAPEGRPHSAAELRRHLDEAAAMSAEPSLPRAMAALPPELVVHPGPTGAGIRDEDPVSVPFTLNSFGVVVPRDARGVERTFKRVADVAARLTRRRTADRGEDTESAADPAPVPDGRRLDPVYDAEHARTAIVPSDGVAPDAALARAATGPSDRLAPDPALARAAAGPSDNRALDPVLAGTTTLASDSPTLDPALGAGAAESMSVVATGGTAIAVVTPEESTAVVPSERSADLVPSLPQVLLPAPRRRKPILIGAALAVVALITAVAVPSALRARASVDRGGQPGADRQGTGSRAVIAPAAVEKPAASGESAVAVPQASLAPPKPSTGAGAASATQRPTPTPRPAASSERVAEVPRLPTIATPMLALPQSASGSAVIAADLIVDARSRVSVASEQADQGNYAAARQTLAGALARLDSAAPRASDSESLRGMRREIEAAQKRTEQACGAESELRRRHGQTPLACP